MPKIKAFVNGRICFHGRWLMQSIYVDEETGMIVQQPAEMPTDFVDLKDNVLAPAYLELQTNGSLGFHFTAFKDPHVYQEDLGKTSRHLVKQGVAGFYVTLPTVHRDVFTKILPYLTPRTFEGGADLLGCHCEGPWLNPAKKGAHDETLMKVPGRTSIQDAYGDAETRSAIKLVTLAPELEGSEEQIRCLSEQEDIVVSIGHSAADFDTGLAAIKAGAKALTHVFNAMSPLHHRSPGLAGLVASPEAPYFSLIADGIHLHPATLTMAFRSNPQRCILITDSVEMAGMPDGIYPGHAQVPHPQRKTGNKVTIDGTDTLVGSCSGLDECVRNLKSWSGCSLPEAVRCVTENVAGLMGDTTRGVIEAGRRADFVVLDSDGIVIQTWVKGKKVYDRS